MLEFLTGLKAALHDTILGQAPLLERAVFQLLDFLTGPVTGIGTRFHWFQLLEAVALSAIVYAAGRQVRPSGGWLGFVRFLFPKALYGHASSMIDYQLAILNTCFGFVFNVTWRFNTIAMTALLLAWLERHFGPAPHTTAWAPALLVAVTVWILLAEDLANYIFHVLTHKIPFMWALHRVHHSAEVLTPITALRTHPLEYAFAAVWRGAFTSAALAPVLYWFTGPPATIEIFGMGAIVIVMGALGTTLQHSHIWLSFGRVLDHVICGPAVHQIHHSQAPEHWDCNFGVMFSFWDWMFGTLVLPGAPKILVLGLAGEARQPHPNAIAAWLLPLWEMVPFRRAFIDRLAWMFGPGVSDLAVRMCLIRPPAPAPALTDDTPERSSRVGA